MRASRTIFSKLKIYIFLTCVALSSNSFAINYLTTANGAVGDGVADDTDDLQAALTYCSSNNVTCEIPPGKTHYVTGPLFMWGGASLTSSSGGGIKFNDVNGDAFLFNLGISKKLDNTDPPAFTGTISSTVFTVAGGVPGNGYGRIIYLWRTQGATITGNIFNYGAYSYGATASGNNMYWLVGNPIRKHITITNNIINSFSGQVASEGFGLVNFEGGTNGEPNLIQGNVITGVGDDPIGIHFSDNVKILSNVVRSTDGRIYVSNSTNIEIGNNKAIRTPSRANGAVYTGIGLVYVGFEDGNPVAGGYTWFSPDSINIHDNQLYFPQGSIDNGAAISLYGVRNTSIAANTIVNDAVINNHFGLILNAVKKVNWYDPSSISPVDTTTSCATTNGTPNCVAKVHGPITIDNNVSGVTQGSGAQALKFFIYDVDLDNRTCNNYTGPLTVTNNSYPAFDGLNFFQGCSNLVVTDSSSPNVFTSRTFVDADSDGYPDMFDNCPSVSNADQFDIDGNGVGDVCQHGLTASYFDDADTDGGQISEHDDKLVAPAALQRIDANINFDWQFDSPAPGFVNTDNFSARWTGRLAVPAYTGTYEFCVIGDDGVRLWVNGDDLLDFWIPQDSMRRCASIALTAGQSIPIVLEFFDLTEESIVKLRWSYPGVAEQAVPSSALFAR